MAYVLSPTPTSGTGAGLVPGQLGLPTPAADLATQIPGLAGINKTMSGDIMSQLQGELSPGTLNALKTNSAQWGVGSGMPGSGLNFNNLMGNIAGFSEGQVAKGEAAYSPFVGAVSGTQTVSPELQTTIAQQNALNAAAPSPSYAEQLFQQYMQGVRGPGGGTMIGNAQSNTDPSRLFLQQPMGM